MMTKNDITTRLHSVLYEQGDSGGASGQSGSGCSGAGCPTVRVIRRASEVVVLDPKWVEENLPPHFDVEVTQKELPPNLRRYYHWEGVDDQGGFTNDDVATEVKRIEDETGLEFNPKNWN